MTLAALKALAGTREWQDWRWQLAHSISEPRSLAEALQLDVRVAADVRRVHCRYPVLATPYYLALARTTSLSDPILRQCVPLLEELRDAPAAGEDPLGEEQDAPVPNLVHRYADRALLLLTARCALHCRHCMRKRRWRDAREAMNGSALEPALEYVRAHPEIREVLLSGGDPLLLDPEFLARVLRQLHALPHVEEPFPLPRFVLHDEPFAGHAGRVHRHFDMLHRFDQVRVPAVFRPRTKENLFFRVDMKRFRAGGKRPQ